MMNKEKKSLLIVLGIIIVLGLVLGYYVILNKPLKIKELNNEYYTLKYDTSWKVKEKNKDQIILKHANGSKITIDITKLTSQNTYSEIKEIIDEVLYTVEEQNSDYQMISQKEEKIGLENVDGYKVLFENDQEQAMLITYKKGDKLVSFIFEANSNYFDILLDSVLTIVDNFKIKEENFDLKSELKIETSNISFSKNDEFDKILTDTQDYEIAYSNYYVNYTLPKVFKLSDLDSISNYFSYSSGFDHVYLSVNIFNRNIYEYLSPEETGNIYESYKSYKEDEKYKNFEESLAKLTSDYDSYLYKNSYEYDTLGFDENLNQTTKKTKKENVELIYALNNNHILIIKIESSGNLITEKLIKQIKLNKVINYASFIKNEKEGNFLIGSLQRYADYKNESIEEVKIKIPDKYKEKDQNTNLYLKRDYFLNYNEDLKINDYDVHYELSDLSETANIEILNSLLRTRAAYGEFQNLTYTGKLTSNNKVFKVYDGGYTDLSGIMFTDVNRNKYYVNKKVLFYEMSEGYLSIEIDGNGKEITDEMINELTNFTVEVKKN